MRSGRYKVLGIGLSRTGTTSLTEALRLLGYCGVHHPLYLLSLTGGALALDGAFPGAKGVLPAFEPRAYHHAAQRGALPALSR